MRQTTVAEKGQRSVRITAYIVTLFFVITALIPVLWMLSSSLKSESDSRAYPPKWVPSMPQSIRVTIDYSGMAAQDATFYEKEAMMATWYPWMRNVNENIGEIQVIGIRDGVTLFRARTNSASFHAGQPLIVPSTLFSAKLMTTKLPIIHAEKLSTFAWYGGEGAKTEIEPGVSDRELSARFEQFYQSASYITGHVTSIKESNAWLRIFDSYLSLNHLAQGMAGGLGFFQYFINSAITSISTVAIQLVFGGLAGYTLSQLLRSKRWQFFWIMFFLATIMIPDISLLLPLYLLMKDLNLVNSLLAIILPHTAWGIVIFLFKGFFDQISKELVQAARVDGASDLRTFTHIVVPLSIPVFTVVAVMTFIPVWNEFVWPLVVNNLPQNWTFTVALNDLQNRSSVQQNVLMASSFISMIPLLIVFLTSQKYIEKGVAFSGVKG